jgi:hypothetical protein
VKNLLDFTFSVWAKLLMLAIRNNEANKNVIFFMAYKFLQGSHKL